MQNRTSPLIPLQRNYWNGLADEYQRITRIRSDDFHYGPQIPGESELRLLPPFRKGQRALELGCGGAQNSIWLARQGVECVAVDLSSGQLRHARRLARRQGVEIKFLRAPLETFHETVKGRFDFVHSSHALEFVGDPAPVLLRMARCLKPGGTLMVSTVHPLYNGDWIDGSYEDDAGGEAGGWGLFLRHYFNPPDDIRELDGRVQVVSRAHPLSSWFRWLRQAGLVVLHLEEPRAVDPGVVPPYTSDDWAVPDGELHAIPGTVIFVARRGECP